MKQNSKLTLDTLIMELKNQQGKENGNTTFGK